jgi:hypothetical protein
MPAGRPPLAGRPPALAGRLPALSDDQAAAYGRFAGSRPAGAVFFLEDADRALIARRRGDHNWLGFGLQLGTVRFLGAFPANPLDLPPVVVDSWRPGLVLNAVCCGTPAAPRVWGVADSVTTAGTTAACITSHAARGTTAIRTSAIAAPAGSRCTSRRRRTPRSAPFPGLASIPEPSPAPEKAVGQEARESVNRLIVA